MAKLIWQFKIMINQMKNLNVIMMKYMTMMTTRKFLIQRHINKVIRDQILDKKYKKLINQLINKKQMLPQNKRITEIELDISQNNKTTNKML